MHIFRNGGFKLAISKVVTSQRYSQCRQTMLVVAKPPAELM